MPLMTQADYARHRGCSAPTVQDAKKVRIKPALVERNGKVLIDSDVADRLWDAAKVRNSHKGKGPAAPAGPANPPAALPPNTTLSDKDLQAFIQGLPEDQIPDTDVSIKRKEHYNAERAKIAALTERDEVVVRSETRAEAFACARAVRDALLSLADRLAPQLAATTDTRECHRLLTEEHRIALRGLADG